MVMTIQPVLSYLNLCTLIRHATDNEKDTWMMGTKGCQCMGINGRAAVDAAFSWDSIAEQAEEVYFSLN